MKHNLCSCNVTHTASQPIHTIILEEREGRRQETREIQGRNKGGKEGK